MALSIFERGYDPRRNVYRLHVLFDDHEYTLYVKAYAKVEADRMRLDGESDGRVFNHLLIASRNESKRRAAARLVNSAVDLRRKFKTGDRVVSKVTGIRGEVSMSGDEFVRVRLDGGDTVLELHISELDFE